MYIHTYIYICRERERCMQGYLGPLGAKLDQLVVLVGPLGHAQQCTYHIHIVETARQLINSTMCATKTYTPPPINIYSV